MYYRVAGEPNSDDRHSGACSLQSFTCSEISPLLHLLKANGRINFAPRSVTHLSRYREAKVKLRQGRSELEEYAKARPLMHQDEIRLVSCLTLDTLSKRDHAIIVIMRTGGFRAEQVARIRMDLHINERFVPDGCLEFTVPSVKTLQGVPTKLVLKGYDFQTVKRWLDHRKEIFRDIPLLFINTSGGPITCDSVSRMLDLLSQGAGYGKSFFTSHSLRAGYATRKAAVGFSKGQSFQDVSASLTDGIRWSPGSEAVNHYLDANVRRFFSGGLGMNLEEFENIGPEQFHDLRKLGPIRKRKLTWFHHPMYWLNRICSNLGILPSCDQTECRRIIAGKLSEIDPEFKAVIETICLQSGRRPPAVMSDLVGILLENKEIHPHLWRTEPSRSELIKALVIRSLDGTYKQAGRTAQKELRQTLHSRTQAINLISSNRKRIYARSWRVGETDTGDLVNLGGRAIESGCLQAQLPALVIDDLPTSPRSVSASSESIRSTRRSTSSTTVPSYRVTPFTSSTITSTPRASSSKK